MAACLPWPRLRLLSPRTGSTRLSIRRCKHSRVLQKLNGYHPLDSSANWLLQARRQVRSSQTAMMLLRRRSLLPYRPSPAMTPQSHHHQPLSQSSLIPLTMDKSQWPLPHPKPLTSHYQPLHSLPWRTESHTVRRIPPTSRSPLHMRPHISISVARQSTPTLQHRSWILSSPHLRLLISR